MSPYLKSTFARLIAMINKQKFEDYRSFFQGQMSNKLQKRQALLMTGIAMSAAAIYESFELDATMNEVKSRQNLLVRHVDSIMDDMKTTIRNVKRLYGAIVLTKANSLSQSAIISLESAVLEMSINSQKFFTGLDNLLNHKLFSGMQQALRVEGFETVFQCSLDLPVARNLCS